MKKNMRFFGVILGFTAWIASIMFFLFKTSTDTIEFKESQDLLINPARGFYVQYTTENEEYFSTLRDDGITVMLLAYDIHDFVDSPLSDEKLLELKNALEIAKQNAIKIVFRAAYGFDSAYQYKDPNNINIVIQHINQIAPILNEYQDIILCVQAGFLGPWGEWHSSNLLPENEGVSRQNRINVLSALFGALDNNIIINIRRPKYVREAVAAGMDNLKLGVHNDALLASDNDMGTYNDFNYSRTDELQWMDENIRYSVNGGEMPTVSTYTKAAIADQEFRQMNITYLNILYNSDVLDDWKTQVLNGNNAYDEINKHLGYRLYLDKIELPKRIKQGDIFRFKIKMNNSGYAAIQRGYKASLVISDQNRKYYYPLTNWDLNLLAGGDTATNIGKIELPAQLIGDAFRIGISITSEALDNDQEYKDYVILANEDFSYEEGINYFCTYAFEKVNYRLVAKE